MNPTHFKTLSEATRIYSESRCFAVYDQSAVRVAFSAGTTHCTVRIVLVVQSGYWHNIAGTSLLKSEAQRCVLVGLSVVHFLSDGMVCIADPHGPFVTASACRLLTAAVGIK